MDASPQRFGFSVKETQIGKRLDVVLSGHLADCSRSYAAQLIQDGAVAVNGKPSKPAYRVRLNDAIQGDLPAPTACEFKPEPIALSILYEDPHLLVVDKPPHLVVHPAPGHFQGTLVNALLHHCPDLAAFRGEIRPGIVHRLDKDTSGALVVAKTPAAHAYLARQFKQRKVHKTYLAIVQGELKTDEGAIRLPIGRHPVHRKRMSTTATRNRSAETLYRVRERLPGATLLELDLKTGRTHQIRVHCAALHHPILGDAVYGGRGASRVVCGDRPLERQTLQVRRQMLHAWRLGFFHPADHQWRRFEAGIPEDMQAVLDVLRRGCTSG
jgi:23S rRNA pseudouridine1911/1915/1917 synthase